MSYNTYCLKRQELTMNPSTLPSSFDVVVVGTGLEESVVAAAAARVGHTILHLDPRDFYGDAWAAFSFDGLQEWIKREEEEDKDEGAKLSEEDGKKVLKEGEKLLPLRRRSVFKKVKQEWNVPEDDEDEKDLQETKADEKPEGSASKGEKEKDEDKVTSQESEKTEPESGKKEAETADSATGTPNAEASGKKKESPGWTRKKILDYSRRFNLDLVPRLLFSRGSMVELLISSNVARYTEFKSATRVLTVVRDGGNKATLEHVPSSRADVFSTRSVSVVEKRILMKFLSACAASAAAAEEGEEGDSSAPPMANAGQSFKDFLRQHKLTPNLTHFVVRSIAMVPEDASAEEGLAATRRFLSSLGRFGNTPFLWPMYGAGELPQAFCRLCAVFGGTYFLARPVEAVVLAPAEEDRARQRVAAIVTAGARIECKKLVLPAALCPPELRETK